MMRFDSPAASAGDAATATIGGDVAASTNCPGDGGGGGTNGRGAAGSDAFAGVVTDGVGREGYGVPESYGSFAAGVMRRIPGMLAGVAAATAGDRTGVEARGVIAGFVSGVVAPTAIRRIAPQTLHRARTPFGGTLAGSTRNTDRQS
jgi:hypothetical protein